MSEVTVPFTIPEVNGTFNAWCGNCASMTDINNDSIWEIIIPLTIGNYEYKFSADNWNIQENLLSGLPCTITNFGYTNRILNVSGNTTLGVVCWESCDPCGSGPSAYNVTFQVDMTGVSGFTTPEVNGTFNGWCGNCWAMSDLNGDSIWDFTTLLAPGSYEYKFSADNWNIQEALDSNLSCVLTTIDSLGNVFVNRYLNIYSDTILDVVCWNECDTCSTIPSSVLNIQGDSFRVYPNPTKGVFYIKSYDKIDKIAVYDILNKKLFEKHHPELLQKINLTDIDANILFLEIYINDKIIREKIVITK